MGFSEFLTLVFITLKLTHVIDWSWWAVLAPELIAFGVYFVVLVVALIIVGVTGKKVKLKIKR